jgi:hypothetical protein
LQAAENWWNLLAEWSRSIQQVEWNRVFPLVRNQAFPLVWNQAFPLVLWEWVFSQASGNLVRPVS